MHPLIYPENLAAAARDIHPKQATIKVSLNDQVLSYETHGHNNEDVKNRVEQENDNCKSHINKKLFPSNVLKVQIETNNILYIHIQILAQTATSKKIQRGKKDGATSYQGNKEEKKSG